MSVPPYKQVIFGTVNGAIGVMAVLSKDDFNLLLKVQHALAQVIKGVGGFRHEVRVLVYVRARQSAAFCILFLLPKVFRQISNCFEWSRQLQSIGCR